MEDGQRLHSPSFSSLATVYLSFCLHVSLKRNINIVHEILHVKYNDFRKFSEQNIFITKRNEKNFSHKLFGIEINANENEANYGINKCVQCVLLEYELEHKFPKF